MILSEACMNGVELRMPDGGTYLVDFVVADATGVYVLLAGWWRVDWPNGENVFRFMPGSLVEHPDRWEITGNHEQMAVLSPSLSDAESQRRHEDERLKVDLNKLNYLTLLDDLKTTLPEADFTQWQDLAVKRPAVSAIEKMRRRNLGNREIAGLVLLGGENEAVDALVFDAVGNAHVVSGNAWLQTFADTWMAQDNYDELEDYLHWIQERQPYGSLTIGKAQVFFSEGSLEDIGLALMRH